MVGMVMVMAALGGLYYLTASVVNTMQQSKDDAAYYRDVSDQLRETNRELRKQNTALRRQQEALVKYFEDQGRVVPGNLGGSGPPVSVIRRESLSSHSSDGGTERRIVRRSATVVQPSQPAQSAPSQSQERDEPAVRVPDLPAVPKVVPDMPVPDVVDEGKKALVGTPLDGVL